jgi:hypothetical protein
MAPNRWQDDTRRMAHRLIPALLADGLLRRRALRVQRGSTRFTGMCVGGRPLWVILRTPVLEPDPPLASPLSPLSHLSQHDPMHQHRDP